MTADPIKPVLLIVDFQEDFCSKDGALSVPDAPAILPHLSHWHPANHVSFASVHNEPPFTTKTLANPKNPDETIEATLWPVHCVEDTPGAQFPKGFDARKLHGVVQKGMNPDVEMYSAFFDEFREPKVVDSGLEERLRSVGVTHVFVSGLAADYCVAATALDSQALGFKTFIIEEATRPVDQERWTKKRAELQEAGVQLISIDGPEIKLLTGK